MASKKAPKASYIHQLWSQVIRERDDYTCTVCGRNFRHDTGALDASHLRSRGMGGGSPHMKYALLNGSAKCKDSFGPHPNGCHTFMDRHPMEHLEWIKGFLGEERYAALRDLEMTTNDLPKMADKDKKELAATLRGHLKSLRARRAAGEIGVLEI